MRYDLLYIIPAHTEDEPVMEAKKKITEMLQAVHATIVREEEPGKRKLSYPIKKTRHGNYVNVIFEAEGAAVAQLKKDLSLNTDIVRYQIIQEEKTAGKSGGARKMRPAAKPLISPAITTAPTQADTGSKVSLQELDQKLEELLSEKVA